jgi:hypothetical protein
MSTNKKLYYGLSVMGLTLAVWYLYKKKQNAITSGSENVDDSTGTIQTNSVANTNVKSTDATQNKNIGIIGSIERFLGINSAFTDKDNPKIDTTTKGYKKTNDALNKWKMFMRDYRKDGLNLRDSNSDKLLGKEATETAYVFATKELASIEKGIKADNSLNDVQKVLLLDKIKSYYNDFLPLFFDKSRYNMSADWYKKAISKMTLVDYYK